MAKITYEYPIKDLCGRVDKQSRIVFAHRADTKYSRMLGVRTTPPTEKELAHRAKFKNVLTATRERLNDPAQNAADLLAFSKQSKYKTLHQYVFNQEWTAYTGN